MDLGKLTKELNPESLVLMNKYVLIANEVIDDKLKDQEEAVKILCEAAKEMRSFYPNNKSDKNGNWLERMLFAADLLDAKNSQN